MVGENLISDSKRGLATIFSAITVSHPILNFEWDMDAKNVDYNKKTVCSHCLAW